MTATQLSPEPDAASVEVPTASPERFERFTAREAEVFLASRFSLFVARGLDCTTALLRATQPDKR